MQIPVYIVDAFSNGPFTGNPAAVCPLDTWLPTPVMQSIAAQHNLSETAFFVNENGQYHIRWFTPTIEVPLCGHATLAAAHVLFNELNIAQNELVFTSKSGELRVQKKEDILTLNFPSEELHAFDYPEPLTKGIVATPLNWGKGRVFFLIELRNEEEVLNLNPDFHLLKKVAAAGIIVTAKGNTVDFVSRVFAPQSGIDEDPVTGSAHCLLIPYWANKLQKNTLVARQLSKRGGLLYCSNQGDRVLIGGKAQTYSKGEIILNV